MGDFLLDSFNIGVPHIHHVSLQGSLLPFGQAIEKSVQGSGLTMFADSNLTSSQIIQDNGQIPVSPADRNLVDGQNPKSFVAELPVLPFQKEFVDVLEGLPIQVQVLADFFYGHDLAQLVDVLGQPKGYPQVRVEEFQVFDDDALTLQAEDLAVLAMEPNSSRYLDPLPFFASSCG